VRDKHSGSALNDNERKFSNIGTQNLEESDPLALDESDPLQTGVETDDPLFVAVWIPAHPSAILRRLEFIKLLGDLDFFLLVKKWLKMFDQFTESLLVV